MSPSTLSLSKLIPAGGCNGSFAGRLSAVYTPIIIVILAMIITAKLYLFDLPISCMHTNSQAMGQAARVSAFLTRDYSHV